MAAGGATALGSGAFTSVEADRSITVDVADDRDAFLVLDEIGDGGRAVIDGGMLRFSFPGAFEDQYPNDVDTDGCKKPSNLATPGWRGCSRLQPSV